MPLAKAVASVLRRQPMWVINDARLGTKVIVFSRVQHDGRYLGSLLAVCIIRANPGSKFSNQPRFARRAIRADMLPGPIFRLAAHTHMSVCRVRPPTDLIVQKTGGSNES